MRRHDLRGALVRAAAGICTTAILVGYTDDARADDTTTTLTASPPAHRFGDRGDVVLPLLGASIGLGGTNVTASAFGFSHSSAPSGDQILTTTMVSFAPSADFFVARHFSVGGTVSAHYSRYAFEAQPAENVLASSSGTIQVGIAPRVGFVAPLGEHTALWPRLQVGFSAADTVGDDDSYVVNPFAFTTTIDVPFVYSVDRHFYASIAPFVEGTWFPKVSTDPAGTGLSFGSQVEIGLVF